MVNFLKPLVGGLAGVVLGWWLAGAADHSVSTSPATSGISAGTVEYPSLRPEEDLVTLPKSQFSETLLGSLSAAGLVDTYFIENTKPPEGHNALTTRLGMDQNQLASFHRVFKQAALDRLAWEKAHAEVKSISPGEWEIRIPGDRGEADRALRDELTRTFGSEVAREIERGSDLDGFFNLQEIDPEFRHGTLRLRARRESMGQPLPSWMRKERVRVAVQWDERITTFFLTDGSFQESRLANRLGRLVGGLEVVENEAPMQQIRREPAK